MQPADEVGLSLGVAGCSETCCSSGSRRVAVSERLVGLHIGTIFALHIFGEAYVHRLISADRLREMCFPGASELNLKRPFSSCPWSQIDGVGDKKYPPGCTVRAGQ